MKKRIEGEESNKYTTHVKEKCAETFKIIKMLQTQ